MLSRVNLALKDDMPELATTSDINAIKAEFHPSNTANVTIALPTGSIITTMGKTAPDGYLICDGTVYNIEDYQDLANYFTTQFESANYFGGDGETTFAVPDLRGEFLRGSGTNSHANQGDGANVGVHQDGTRHIATPFIQESGDYYFVGTKNNINKNPTDADAINTYDGQFFNTASGNNDTTRLSDYTARPTNTSVLYSIKY